MSAPKVKASGVVGAILGIVGMSAVAGILVTAMVAPALAVTGLAANNSISMFENLPSYIKPDELAQKSEIYAVRGGQPIVLAEVYDENREEVGWDQISQYVKDAVVATEDPRFYSHGGVDIVSAGRAALQNAASGEGPGASTISMQYVRNILVQRTTLIKDEAAQEAAFKEATVTTIDRKLKEMKLAIGLEKEFTKDEILLGYLNIANFGGTVYGIESAARYYYGVSARDVSIAQAASLVAMVNEPNGLRIDQPEFPEKIVDNQQRRDDDILASMLREKRITQAQFDEAVATPVTPNIQQPSTGCQTANTFGASFFCDYVSNIIKNDPSFGASEDERWQKFRTGGYKIFTTLDVDLQEAAINNLNAVVPQVAAEFDIGAAMVTVQPGTGKVLAMVQNKSFNADPETTLPNETSVNFSTDYAYGGSTGFPSGSTYKVFTLAEWLKQGNSLGQNIDGNVRAFNLSTFKNSCEGENGGSYTTKNDGSAKPGSVSITQATAASINNAFIGMAQKLDMCEITKTAESFGMHRADGEKMKQNVSSVLGTNEVSPLSVANSYATIAAGGVHCNPTAIESMYDAHDQPVAVPQANCTQVVDPNVAYSMAIAMAAVMSGGGTGTASNPGNGIPHIGKTGTTDGEKHTWFAGATTKLATAIWVGNIVGGVSLRYTSVGDYNASSMRHAVWSSYMAAADSKYGGDEFPRPDSKYTQSVQVAVPDVRGKSMEEAASILEAAGFGFVDGGPIDSELPAGVAAATNPAAGSSAVKGSDIAVHSSNQLLVAVPVTKGLTYEAAKSALEGAGFKIGGRSNQKTADCPTPAVAIGTTPVDGGGFANPATQAIAITMCQK